MEQDHTSIYIYLSINVTHFNSYEGIFNYVLCCGLFVALQEIQEIKSCLLFFSVDREENENKQLYSI